MKFKYTKRDLPSLAQTHNLPGELYYYFNCKYFKHYRQRYKGIIVGKCLGDLWNYQEIMHEIKAGWVLETGTFQGGAACFYADFLKNINAEGCVVSVDLMPEKISKKALKQEDVHFITGNSTSPETVDAIKKIIPFDKPDRKPIFVSLDSEHHYKHVLKELKTYIPLLKKGDYLVVEDGKYYNINGPNKAVEMFESMDLYKRVELDVQREKKTCGFTSVVRGYFKIVN